MWSLNVPPENFLFAMAADLFWDGAAGNTTKWMYTKNKDKVETRYSDAAAFLPMGVFTHWVLGQFAFCGRQSII